jgi:hypothetical protein
MSISRPLNGQEQKFRGAFIANISSSLGLTTQPSSASVTLVEDPFTGAIFNRPSVGEFVEIGIGPSYKFSGIVMKIDIDVKNISGRRIQVSINDAREIMRTVPIILAPGYRAVAEEINGTACSVLDAFGAFDSQEIGINLSEWNHAGMPYKNIALAINGGTIVLGETEVKIPQQVVNAYGERYLFDFSEVSAMVASEHRVNTNLVTMADFLQELANRNSFDWYIESRVLESNIKEIKIKVIDRSEDNIDVDLEQFLSDNNDKVISARSGIELRTDIACTALLGAPIEQMDTYEIKGMANEPVNLEEEGGSSEYLMSEIEMRVVLGGRQAWESWLGCQRIEDAGVPESGQPIDIQTGVGFSRYGGDLDDSFINPLFDTRSGAIFVIRGVSAARAKFLGEAEDKLDIVSKVFEKLKGHAEATYGKRFVFNPPGNVEVIDAAWTLNVLGGEDIKSPNEFFRDENGKTRGYVQFSSPDTENPFSLGLGDLGFDVGDLTQALPGLAGFSVPTDFIVLGLSDFNPKDAMIEADKSNYFWATQSTITGEEAKGNLYVSATIDREGKVIIDSPITESKPNQKEFDNFMLACITATAGNVKTKNADGTEITSASGILLNFAQQNGGSFFKLHSRVYQPKRVIVPTRSKFNRYGPVFPSELSQESQGKLEIINDDGFAPWEFGGFSLMLQAMQLKVDSAASAQRDAQTADIVVEGFPTLSLGDQLGRNSNINNITISLSNQITTTYRLQTYTRKFGELSKDEATRISLYAARGGDRIFSDNQIQFYERYRRKANKQFSGRGNRSESSTTGGGQSFG